MCTLRLGVISHSEDYVLQVPCEYQHIARTFVETLGKRAAWPKTEIASLDLWEEDSPFVVRMDYIWAATVESCAEYRAFRRVTKEQEESEPEKSPEPTTKE